MHEWLRYRDRHIRKLVERQRQAELAEQEKRREEGAEPAAQEKAESQPEAAVEISEAAEAAEAAEPVEAAAQEAEAAPRPEAGQAPQPVEEEAAPDEAAAAEPERKVAEQKPAKPRRRAPRTRKELLESLQPTKELRERLEAVLARQGRLPLEVDDGGKPKRRRGRAVETREQLVARLLDPTLTLQETALLLGVCPTTVRRYTNRGILKCFRTPGNQRRFKLSDVLEFMERQQQAEIKKGQGAGTEEED